MSEHDHSEAVSLWAAGFDGIVYRSKNSGRSWQWSKVSGGERLYAIHCDSPLSVWVGGWGGAIYHTVDSGRTWQRCQTGTDDRITAMTRSSDGRLWAVGDNGLVLINDSGGDAFRISGQLGERGLRCIRFNNHGNGIIIGYGGAAWLTSDNGDNWHEIEQLKANRLDLYGCEITDTRVRVVGSFGCVMVSDLNAREWQVVDLHTRAYLRHIHFSDEQHGVITGYGSVYKTDDGGATWFQLGGEFPFQLLCSASPDGSRIWTAGEYGTLYYWGPEHNVWSAPLLGVGITWHDLAYSTADQKIWMVGSHGFVQYSEDGGRTWSTQQLVPAVDLTSIVFSGDGKGVIAAENGHIWLKAADQDTWQHQELPEKGDINHLTIDRSDHFWVCGQAGLLYKSDDTAGRQWTKIDNRFKQDLYSMTFSDQNTAWLVGQKGLIMQTENDGGFYFANYSGIEQDLIDIKHGPAGLIAVGRSGTIMENISLGQGSSWQYTDISSGATLRSVVRTAPGDDWVIGDGAQLWSRMKGSSDWRKTEFPFSYDFEVIAVSPDNCLIVAGENSLVMIKCH